MTDFAALPPHPTLTSAKPGEREADGVILSAPHLRAEGRGEEVTPHASSTQRCNGTKNDPNNRLALRRLSRLVMRLLLMVLGGGLLGHDSVMPGSRRRRGGGDHRTGQHNAGDEHESDRKFTHGGMPRTCLNCRGPGRNPACASGATAST